MQTWGSVALCVVSQATKRAKPSGELGMDLARNFPSGRRSAQSSLALATIDAEIKMCHDKTSNDLPCECGLPESGPKILSDR
jgi:hypothetical protein